MNFEQMAIFCQGNSLKKLGRILIEGVAEPLYPKGRCTANVFL